MSGLATFLVYYRTAGGPAVLGVRCASKREADEVARQRGIEPTKIEALLARPKPAYRRRPQ